MHQVCRRQEDVFELCNLVLQVVLLFRGHPFDQAFDRSQLAVDRQHIPAALKQNSGFGSVSTAQVDCQPIVVSNIIAKIAKCIQQELTRRAARVF